MATASRMTSMISMPTIVRAPMTSSVSMLPWGTVVGLVLLVVVVGATDGDGDRDGGTSVSVDDDGERDV